LSRYLLVVGIGVMRGSPDELEGVMAEG
jgi:hypothetical protein